jgi:hypothetical protein
MILTEAEEARLSAFKANTCILLASYKNLPPRLRKELDEVHQDTADVGDLKGSFSSAILVLIQMVSYVLECSEDEKQEQGQEGEGL